MLSHQIFASHLCQEVIPDFSSAAGVDRSLMAVGENVGHTMHMVKCRGPRETVNTYVNSSSVSLYLDSSLITVGLGTVLE
jgi:hypothetical protein